MSDLQSAMASCSTCPKMCRHVCPTAIASGRESRTPTAISTMGLLWDRGQLALDDDVRQAFYDCAHCGACAEPCEVDGVDLIAETRYLRARLVALGEALPAVVAWGEASAHDGRVPGTPVETLTRFARRDAGARTLFLIGSATARHGEATIAAALATATARGEAVATLGADETATGGEALDLGFPDLARWQAETLAARLQAGPWERIVALDPSDALTLIRDWPGLGVTLGKPVVTLPTWLQENAARVSTAPGTVSERVTYHDPCALGRGLGEVEGPRALIRALGATLVEPDYAGRDARCCGGGGGLPVTNPALADAVTELRATALRALGVDRVLTACATCASRLASALGPDLPVEDLTVWHWRHTAVH